MSQDFKQSFDTAHNSSAPLLAPEGTPEASSQADSKKRKRRRIELAVGAVALAGVLYLPFSPLFSFYDSSEARLSLADTAAPATASATSASALVSSSSTQGPKILRPSVTAPDANTIFVDAPEDSAYYAGIRWAVRTQTMEPVSEDTFGAEDPVTRGELITMFYQLAGSPALNRPEHSPYADVDESDPNYDAYLWARQERITSGWVDGKFHAEARLSNASAVALLYRADGAQKIQMSGSSPFSDVSSATPFYRQIVWASRRGVSTVSEGNAFEPTAQTSRGRVAMMMYLYFRTS
ncbi:S-layer homology domain-containing protein [uncultured Rothia sp.]|uniref:S-layer homology domain-containing protein n=1 Tax=uncultured Rothia sp. TaxID=316088 RepID=UPI0028DB6628|nr:S-layer homology domain-containing protein [uncultured Rothia sp.]